MKDLTHYCQFEQHVTSSDEFELRFSEIELIFDREDALAVLGLAFWLGVF